MNAPSNLLLGYQQTLLATVSAHALTVAEKSRRIGYTWGIAALAALTAAASRSAGGMDVFYIAYEKEMTREFIDTCSMWAKEFASAAHEVEEFVWKDNKQDEGIFAFRIVFDSGFEIVALSSSPRGLRGRQGLVIIDEAAFHDDLDELLKAALALLMWGGRVVVISTHNGISNPFNRLLEDIRARKRKGEVIRVTLDDALADGLYRRICERTGAAWSSEAQATWRRELIDTYGDAADEELFCIPRAGGGQWLPRPLIEARMEKDIPVLRWSCPDEFVDRDETERTAAVTRWIVENLKPVIQAMPKGLFSYFGMDFARSVDRSVMWPMLLMPDLVRRTPFVIELGNVPFVEQKAVLFYVLDNLPRLMKAAIDATGNGASTAEAARQRYGLERVEEVKFTPEWYRVNMPPYKEAFVDSAIVLPRDAHILSDHEQFILDRGIVRLRATRTQSADGQQRHGDSGIAGALAHYASRGAVMEYDYQAIGARRPSDRSDPDSGEQDIIDTGPAGFSTGAW